MNYKIIILLIIIAIIIISILIINKTYTPTMKTKTFSCPGMAGFTFEYPEFKDWETLDPKKINENTCLIGLKQPENINFEVEPKIRIEKIPKLANKDLTIENTTKKNETMIINSLSEIKHNPQDVFYNLIYDDGDLYRPAKPSEWVHIQFYGPDYAVRITPLRHKGEGYSSKKFTNKVIETFKFTK